MIYQYHDLPVEHNWLVVETPLKKMSSSIGMMIPNIWKAQKMFQTTNQIRVFQHLLLDGQALGNHRIP